jgi:chromosome segregation ATPase
MDNKKKTQLLTLSIIIMLIGVGIVGYMLITLNQNYKDLSYQMENTLSAKDVVEENLKQLYSEYDSISTTNDSMKYKLDEEQEKVAVLLSELDNVKAYNASQIRKYQNETETLRGIMKSYVYQIDSLNQLNNQLIAENNEVRKNVKRLEYEIDDVTEHNDELELTVEKAATIKATNISAIPYKRRGKITDKANKTTQIQTKFTLIENNIAETHERVAYLRIIRPDGFVLIKNTENIFKFQEQDIAFSESRTIQYDGEFLDVVIFYNVEQELLEGKYQVELYMDNNIIGSTDLLLK